MRFSPRWRASGTVFMQPTPASSRPQIAIVDDRPEITDARPRLEPVGTRGVLTFRAGIGPRAPNNDDIFKRLTQYSSQPRQSGHRSAGVEPDHASGRLTPVREPRRPNRVRGEVCLAAHSGQGLQTKGPGERHGQQGSAGLGFSADVARRGTALAHIRPNVRLSFRALPPGMGLGAEIRESRCIRAGLVGQSAKRRAPPDVLKQGRAANAHRSIMMRFERTTGAAHALA